ncbi:MAG TPA: hypothetical protein VED20_02820 [Streptosporangiaceae bacterium]|nr:hypothetical protein [Streptosporangiaceae bacterium]
MRLMTWCVARALFVCAVPGYGHGAAGGISCTGQECTAVGGYYYGGSPGDAGHDAR